jgi:hypothetical protein
MPRASLKNYLGIVLDILGFESWCSKRHSLLPGMLMVKVHKLVQRPVFTAQTALASSLVL